MFKIGRKMSKIDPKLLTQKVCELLQNSYSGQKAQDLPSKSYCWSPNLLGSSSDLEIILGFPVSWYLAQKFSVKGFSTIGTVLNLREKAMLFSYVV